jgi:hypothetical protein
VRDESGRVRRSTRGRVTVNTWDESEARVGRCGARGRAGQRGTRGDQSAVPLARSVTD